MTDKQYKYIVDLLDNKKQSTSSDDVSKIIRMLNNPDRYQLIDMNTGEINTGEKDNIKSMNIFDELHNFRNDLETLKRKVNNND